MAVGGWLYGEDEPGDYPEGSRSEVRRQSPLTPTVPYCPPRCPYCVAAGDHRRDIETYGKKLRTKRYHRCRACDRQFFSQEILPTGRIPNI